MIHFQHLLVNLIRFSVCTLFRSKVKDLPGFNETHSLPPYYILHCFISEVYHNKKDPLTSTINIQILMGHGGFLDIVNLNKINKP